LVELLVVIAIIGVLVALLLPAIQAAREAARRAECANNLKQLTLALHNYHDRYNKFPPGYVIYQKPGANAQNTEGGLGWGTHLLPDLEQQSLYDSMPDTQTGKAAPSNVQEGGTVLDAFICPSCPGKDRNDFRGNYGKSNYVGNAGSALPGTQPALNRTSPAGDKQSAAQNLHNQTCNGVFWWNSEIGFEDILDGTSSTIAFGERALNCTRINISGGTYAGANNCGVTGSIWMGARSLTNRGENLGNGNDIPINYNGNSKRQSGPADNPYCRRKGNAWSSFHPGGAHFSLSDGSTRFISQDIGTILFRRLLNREDGQEVGKF